MKKFDYLKFSEDYDDFTRYCKNSIIQPDNEIEEKIEKWRHCNHLFVKVRESNNIECVKCGLTNRFMFLEKRLKDERNIIYNNLKFKDTTYETDEFNYQYPKFNKIEDLSNEKILSHELILTNHPNVLYNIAEYFSKSKTKESIFNIMKNLNDLETVLEKTKIRNIIMSSALIERYKDFVVARTNRIEFIKEKKKIYLVK